MRSFSNAAESCSFHHLVYYQCPLKDFQILAPNIRLALDSQGQFQDCLQFIQNINFFFYSHHLFYFELNQMLFADLISNLESLSASFNLYNFAEQHF